MKDDEFMRISPTNKHALDKLGHTNDTYNSVITKMLKNYEIMMKISREHMKDCPKFQKQILKEMDFDEE